jgi:hypothetical protein
MLSLDCRIDIGKVYQVIMLDLNGWLFLYESPVTPRLAPIVASWHVVKAANRVSATDSRGPALTILKRKQA